MNLLLSKAVAIVLCSADVLRCLPSETIYLSLCYIIGNENKYYF